MRQFDDRWQMEYVALSAEFFRERKHCVSLRYDAENSTYDDFLELTHLLNRVFEYASENGYLTVSISYYKDTISISFIVKEESDFESFARYVAQSQL